MLLKLLGLDKYIDKYVEELLEDMVSKSVVCELKPNHFYVIVLPDGIIPPERVNQVHQFLEDRGIECLLATANKVSLLELGD